MTLPRYGREVNINVSAPPFPISSGKKNNVSIL